MDPLIPGSAYRTAGHGKRSLFPSLTFHMKMLPIYWRSNRMAVKGRYDGEQWARSSLEVLRALESVGVRFDLEDLDIPYDLQEPCVYIGNHMSTLETFILPCLVQPAGDTTFIVKDSLTRFPVFGPVMRSRSPIEVGRKDPREDLKAVLEGGARRLARGTSIIVFPQTTRLVHFDPSQFNTIGVKLARRGGVPVVPVALKTDAWVKGYPIKDMGPIRPEKTVHIAFGQPLRVAGSGREEHAQVIDFIRGKLVEWEREELAGANSSV